MWLQIGDTLLVPLVGARIAAIEDKNVAGMWRVIIQEPLGMSHYPEVIVTTGNLNHVEKTIENLVKEIDKLKDKKIIKDGDIIP